MGVKESREKKSESNEQHMFLVGGGATQLKNMLVKMDSSSPRFGVNIKNL